MGLSGYVGAGAQDALARQVAEQLRQRMFEEQTREALAREALAAEEQRRRQVQDAAEEEQRQFVRSDVLERRAREANAIREAQAQEQAAQARASDMANVQQMPGLSPEQRNAEIIGSGVRGGQIGPIDLLKLNTPAPKKLREVTTRGPKGEPLNRMVPEDEAVQEYVKPQGPGGGGRIDIRTVQQRGPNGEPGTAVLVYRDGILESQNWSPGNPSATERQAFGDFSTVTEAFKQAREAYEPSLVGPVQGRIGTFNQLSPISIPGPNSDKFTDLKSKVAAIQNQLLYLRSGKAISEPEFVRMMRELPSENDKDQNFLIKLDNAERLLGTYIANRKAAAGVTPAAAHEPAAAPGSAPQRRPIPGIPGAEAELRDGRWIRVK